MRAKRWRKWPILLVAVFTAFCLGSCQDWGEMDPPSGNQQLPNLTELASYDFDDLGSDVSIGIYQGGKAPKVVVDPQLDVVLELDGGYVSYANPLQYNTLQTGASLTGWVKLNAEDANASVFCFSDEAGNKLRLTGNSDLYYNEEKLNANSLLLTAGEWHWFAVAAKPHGYAIYIDGVAVDGTIAPGEGEEVAKAREVMDFMTTAPRLYFGYGSEETPSKMWIDEVTVYKNLITDAEVAKPELKDPNPGGEEPGEETGMIVVGQEDFSSGFFMDYSPLINVESGDCEFHYHFINHAQGANAWENWILGISNGKLPNEDGYVEYYRVRSDAYGWKDNMATPIGNGTGLYQPEYTYDWATYNQDMIDATVDLTVKRVGTTLTIDGLVTTTSGEEMTCKWNITDCPTGAIGAFLSVEKAYLEIDPEEVYVSNLYSRGSNIVGAQDCSTAWWGAWTPKVLFNGDGKVEFQFYDHSSKANIWNYYVTVITTGLHPTEVGYDASGELLILRNDLFGWGNIYNAEYMTEVDGIENMQSADGALVTLSVERKGANISYAASFESGNSTITPYTYQADNFPADQNQWAMFLTVDGCWYDIISIKTYPFIANN